jgi:hypothetical protein
VRGKKRDAPPARGTICAALGSRKKSRYFFRQRLGGLNIPSSEKRGIRWGWCIAQGGEPMRRRHALTKSQWKRIKDLLPGHKGDRGRTAADKRLFVNAERYVL